MSRLERDEELARRQRKLSQEFSQADLEQENRDIIAVLSTEAGRRLLAGIMGRGYVFGDVFQKTNGSDSRLAYETGRREACVDIYRRANIVAPDLVIQAIVERNAICKERTVRFNNIESEMERTGQDE